MSANCDCHDCVQGMPCPCENPTRTVSIGQVAKGIAKGLLGLPALFVWKRERRVSNPLARLGRALNPLALFAGPRGGVGNWGNDDYYCYYNKHGELYCLQDMPIIIEDDDEAPMGPVITVKARSASEARQRAVRHMSHQVGGIPCRPSLPCPAPLVCVDGMCVEPSLTSGGRQANPQFVAVPGVAGCDPKDGYIWVPTDNKGNGKCCWHSEDGALYCTDWFKEPTSTGGRRSTLKENPQMQENPAVGDTWWVPGVPEGFQDFVDKIEWGIGGLEPSWNSAQTRYEQKVDGPHAFQVRLNGKHQNGAWYQCLYSKVFDIWGYPECTLISQGDGTPAGGQVLKKGMLTLGMPGIPSRPRARFFSSLRRRARR